LLSTFFVHFINIEIDIISLRRNHSFCEENCHVKNGHLPYLFEGMEVYIFVVILRIVFILSLSNQIFLQKVESVLQQQFFKSN